MILMGGAVFAFAGLALFSAKTLFDLGHQVELLGHQRIPLSDSFGDIRASANAVPRFMWLSLAQAPNSVDRKKSLERVSEFWSLWQKAVESLSDYNMTEKANQKVTEMKALMPNFSAVIDAGTKLLTIGTKEQDASAKELLMIKMPPIALKLASLVRETSEIIKARNNEIVQEAQSQVNRAQLLLLIISVSLGLSLFIFGFVFSSRLTKQLLDITDSVAEASTQVSAASSQLSNAADQLSSASQEQAAATEETSASLTEISGMVESNVHGAEKANELAREVHTISEDTKKSMQELTQAMSSILESNQRIEQLVKVIEEIGEKTEVIDDIVFKTQLLSFNASVEAERAGEHGRGFAVVAQEVGNLAQMSGKAATEIAGIVKQSIKEAGSIAVENKTRVEKGGSLASETGNKMEKVLSSLGNILETTSKIVAASKEQSQGIGQISTSVDGLNQSTQEIASTSEESASASEELSGQSQSLLSLVQELRQIVTGVASKQTIDSNKGSLPKEKTTESKNNLTSMSDYTKKTAGRPSVRSGAAGRVTSVKKAVGYDAVDSKDEWEKL